MFLASPTSLQLKPLSFCKKIMSSTTYFITRRVFTVRAMVKHQRHMLLRRSIPRNKWWLMSSADHLAHHVLTLYALGASPAIIQRQYNDNKSYQRPPEPVDERVLEDLRDPRKFQQYLGKEKYYHDFLVHFQQAIDDKGYQAVINESLFQRDERADDLLVRMYAGFLHPLIHLGFGVEFKQPAIIAEALAQGAVHDKWIGRYLLEAERAASTTSDVEPLVDLLDKIRVDTKLSTAAQWGDGNKIRDGIMVRAPQEMIKYGSRWKVETSELEKKTAEMVNAAGKLYMAQQPKV